MMHWRRTPTPRKRGVAWGGREGMGKGRTETDNRGVCRSRIILFRATCAERVQATLEPRARLPNWGSRVR
eukprot:1914580-Pyramimonas_sp.AAC.1